MDRSAARAHIPARYRPGAANAFDRPWAPWQLPGRAGIAFMSTWRLTLAKPEWGTKRTCQSCGARFYDFGRTPAVCPACGATFDLEQLTRARRPPRPPARAAAVPDDEEDVPVVGAGLADGEADTEELEEAAELEEEPAEAEEAADEEEEGLIEDASELGEDEDMSDVIEGDIDEEPR